MAGAKWTSGLRWSAVLLLSPSLLLIVFLLFRPQGLLGRKGFE